MMFAFVGFPGLGFLFELLVLLLELSVFLGQGIDTITKVAGFLDQLRDVGLQLFVFLARLGILATYE